MQRHSVVRPVTYLPSLPSPLTYVNSGNAQTVAQLLTNFPAGSTHAGKYAVVSDLYNMGAGSGVVEVLRCRYDVVNSAYRWIPQRQEYNRTMAATNGTVNLTPLVSPPTLIFNGTLSGPLSVSPSPTNAWIGQRYRLIQNSTLGLFLTTLTGLIGSNITLIGNAEQVVEYTSSGWRAMTS